MAEILDKTIKIKASNINAEYCQPMHGHFQGISKGSPINVCLVGGDYEFNREVFKLLSEKDWITSKDPLKAIQLTMMLPRIEVICFDDPETKSMIKNIAEGEFVFKLSCKLSTKEDIHREMKKIIDFLELNYSNKEALATELAKKSNSSLHDWLSFLSLEKPSQELSSIYCDSPVFMNKQEQTLTNLKADKKINQMKGEIKIGEWVETVDKDSTWEGSYSDRGEKEGLWTLKKSGEIVERIHYKSNAISSEEEFEKGIIRKRSHFEDDKHIKVEYFNENGKLTNSTRTLNGLKDGPQEDYYINGVIQNRENYKNDKKHGAQEYYHDTGQIVGIEMYKENIIESRRLFDENGKEVTEEMAK